MKRYFAFAALIILVLVSCSDERSVEPFDSGASSQISLDPEYIAEELVAQTGWPDVDDQLRLPEGCGNIITIEREEVFPGIAHYSFLLKVGEGEYDNIKLHRVVKEKSPYKPIKTCKSVFAQHGDGVAFEGVWLFGPNAPSIPDDHAMAVYMAQNDVDFWGITQNWQLVPQEVTDFSFMAGWGILNQVENLDIAMSIARFTRLLTGGGPGKMILMGYSSGVWTGYAYLDMETQKPERCRNAGGYIAVDGGIKTDDPGAQASMCAFAAQFQMMLDGGIYQVPMVFNTLGYLAVTDPEGDSPLGTGFSNYWTAMYYGAATHLFAPILPWYHYIAGNFDPGTGALLDLQFVTDQGWFEFMMTGSPWEPTLFQLNVAQTVCESVDIPWDDHLAEISVPVLNLSAAGGFGSFTEYTLTLLGSSDITSLNISLYPPEYAAVDFGHIDIFVADNAPDLAWMPTLDWVNDHSCNRGKADQSWHKDR